MGHQACVSQRLRRGRLKPVYGLMITPWVRIPPQVRIPCGILVCMTTYKPNWNLRTYSEDEFIAAWRSSRSVAGCAKRLNLTVFGTTHRTLTSTAESLGLNKDHMTGQGWNRKDQPDRIDLSKINEKSLEDYLVVGSNISSSSLGNKLAREGVLIRQCSAPYCPSPVKTTDGWTGETVDTPVSLDHINGINNDNRLENLRFICAPCDRMTPTFCRGGGSRKSRVSYAERIGQTTCPICSGSKMKTSIMCRSCRKNNPTGFILLTTTSTPSVCECGSTKYSTSNLCKKCYLSAQKGTTRPKQEKISWPSNEILIAMVEETSFLATGKTLGVSDSAVRKRLRTRGLIT